MMRRRLSGGIDAPAAGLCTPPRTPPLSDAEGRSASHASGGESSGDEGGRGGPRRRASWLSALGRDASAERRQSWSGASGSSGDEAGGATRLRRLSAGAAGLATHVGTLSRKNLRALAGAAPPRAEPGCGAASPSPLTLSEPLVTAAPDEPPEDDYYYYGDYDPYESEGGASADGAKAEHAAARGAAGGGARREEEEERSSEDPWRLMSQLDSELRRG